VAQNSVTKWNENGNRRKLEIAVGTCNFLSQSGRTFVAHNNKTKRNDPALGFSIGQFGNFVDT
jgi:hypothetical protein